MKLKRMFVAALVLVCSAVMVAQEMQMPPIPVDPEVRMGKLDNGLTYYIRHNEYPEHVANFYIAQRVGAIQEDESQRGLAHFLEHMAFNGSEHFPSKPEDKENVYRSHHPISTRTCHHHAPTDAGATIGVERRTLQVCDGGRRN